MKRYIILLTYCLLLMSESSGQSDERTSLTASIKLPTLGGMQFWTDTRWWYGWRIQENKVTGHYRLLDPSNIRYHWGDADAVQRRFDEIVAERQWDPPPRRVVVFLHGLMRTHRSFHTLGEQLEGEQDATAVYFGYASTRASVREHADALRSLIEGLPGAPQIDLVGHSLGNIVARHAIADWQRDGDRRAVLPRLGRFVMQGPPNHGANIARCLKSLDLFEIVTGQSGQELGGDWEQFQVNLATPPCEFGIVAGSIDAGPVRNPLVEGASDFVVSIEEARLPGARDFITLPVLHSFLMDDGDVQKVTLRFLESGSFNENGERSPILR